MTLIDFTLSNARRSYSSMGNPLAVKGINRIFVLALLSGVHSAIAHNRSLAEFAAGETVLCISDITRPTLTATVN